jgi:hypothetical protein
MKHYVEERISNSTNLSDLLDNHQSLRDELIDKVVQKADGMYVKYRHALNTSTDSITKVLVASFSYGFT